MNNSNHLVKLFRNYAKQARNMIAPASERQSNLNVEILIKEDKMLKRKNLSYGAQTIAKGDIELKIYPFDKHHIVNGILAREAFNLFLPSAVREINASKDLG